MYIHLQDLPKNTIYNLTKYVQYVQEKEDLSIHHIIIHIRSSTYYFINNIIKIKHNHYEEMKTINTLYYQPPPPKYY